MNTSRTAVFLATLAQQTIRIHAGGAKERVQLHQTDSDSWHHNWRHLSQDRHLRSGVTAEQEGRQSIIITRLHLSWPPKENFGENADLPGGMKEDGEKIWYYPAVMICEISARASEMKSWARQIVQFVVWEEYTRWDEMEVYLPRGLPNIYLRSLHPYLIPLYIGLLSSRSPSQTSVYLLPPDAAGDSNGSGLSHQFQARVRTERLHNWQCGVSIDLNRPLAYGSMQISQPVGIGLVVSGLLCGSISRFI